ncbi:MAG: PPC domain-containing protein [Alphaproteobacteria bacterium]
MLVGLVVLAPSISRAKEACGVVDLSLGSTVHGTIGYEECGDAYGTRFDRYALAGVAGQEISLHLDQESSSAHVSLALPSGEILSSATADLLLTLPVTGTYFVEVTSPYTPVDYELSSGLSRFCPPVAIAAGDHVTGDLSFGDCASLRSQQGDLYTFEGEAGQVVTIELASGSFDAWLALFGHGGNLLAENDDAGATPDSRIEFRLENSGTFTIWATSYSGVATGPYALDLAATAACPSTPIARGQGIDATLGQGGCPSWLSRFDDFYEFEAEAGEQVKIRLRSNVFSGSVRLVDPTGVPLASGDARTASEVVIEARTDVTGTHRIVVSSLKSGATGPYRVDLSELACRTSPVSAGDVVEGGLSETDCLSAYRPRWTHARAVRHVLQGNAGQRFFLRETSPVFSPWLHVSGPDGRFLAQGRYGRLYLTLPTSGSYEIEATMFTNYGSLGPYTLAVQSCASEPISFGQTVSRSMVAEDCPAAFDDYGDSHSVAHVFEGTVGQRVLVRMASASFYPVLHLYGPGGGEVVPESSRVDGITRSFVAVLPASGTFSIEASSARWTYPGSTVGPYDIALSDLVDDLIFADDFESGDLSRWASSSTKGGKLSVAAAAARFGSLGLRFDASGLPPPANKAKLWVKDTSPSSEPRYRARFFLDLHDLTVPTDPRTLRLVAARTAADPSARPFELRLLFQDGIWQVFGLARDDLGVTHRTPMLALPRSWVQVVVDWKAASGPGVEDGFLVVAVDGDLAIAGGIPNDLVRIDGIQLGFLGGLGLSSSGTALVDDFESRREGPFSSLYGAPPTAFLGDPGASLAE